MTAAALEYVCPSCLKPESLGLCSRDACRKAVLPQIAKPALVRLIGDALTEQTKLQQQKLTPKEKTRIAAIGRRNARKVARQKRGYFGLAKAIMGR